MNKHLHTIEKMIQSNQGVISASEVRAAGISPSYLSHLHEIGKIYRIERGLYASSDTYVDEMSILYMKNKFIVFSHLSALYLHDLTDRSPLKMYITVPRTKNISNLIRSENVSVKRSNNNTHSLGLIHLPSPTGFLVPVYSMERTICDIIKHKNQTDSQIFSDALKRYTRRNDKNLSQLIDYAKQLKVENQLRIYMEVLL